MKLAVKPTEESLAQRARIDALEAIEDKLFEDHLRIVNASSRFAEVHPEHNFVDDDPPAAFLEAAGGDKDRAKQDYRIALASWLGPKDAPIGLHNAYKVAMGIAKLRGEQRNARVIGEASRPLAIHVYMGVPIPSGEEKVERQVIEVDE